DDIEAAARLGFLGIAVVGGTGSANASISVGLHNPATGDGRLGLSDLLKRLTGDITSIVTGPDITGSANLVLPVRVTPNILSDPEPANPTLTITWADIKDPSTLNVSPNSDMDRLLDFKDLTFADIVDAFAQVIPYLVNLQHFSFLDQKLPLVNRSVSALVGYADKFAAQVEAIRDNPAGTVQEVNLALKQALGLPADSPLVNVSVAGHVLRLDLAYTTSFQDQLGLNLDLATLAQAAGGVNGLAGVANLIDVAGSARLAVQAAA